MLQKILLFIFCLFAQTFAFSQCNDDIKSGEATFYEGVAGSSGGNCSLPVAPDDFMHCALNNTDYQNSNACGACLEVSGSLGKTIVKVVDRCPECKPGDVDLTEQAFSKIANPIDGRVPITWKFVPCPLSNNQTIKVNFKSGSSQFWTAIQFRDIKHAVSKMEYFQNNAWVNVNRELFNFFIEPKGISSPMKLRITSVLGEQLVLENIVKDITNDFDTELQFKTLQECIEEGNGNTNDNISPPPQEEETKKGYPNPTSSIFNIPTSTNEWIIMDIHGRIITKGSGKNADLSYLSNGSYFLITDNNTFKIIKR